MIFYDFQKEDFESMNYGSTTAVKESQKTCIGAMNSKQIILKEVQVGADFLGGISPPPQKIF